MYYPDESRISALTTIRRERLLPVEGRLEVAPGDEVQATDVVARCRLPAKTLLIDASRELGVARDAAADWISVKAGDAVLIDEVLATSPSPSGAGSGELRSPTGGRVLEVRAGMVLIQTEADFELLAGIRGTITSTVPRRGVVVSAEGAVVQGVWGCGREVVGHLVVLKDGTQEPLNPAQMDASCQGAVLVAGRIGDQAVLERARDAKVAGIVVGSASATLIPWLRSRPFSIMVTDGFGSLSMSEFVFSLLRDHAGLEATLCAEVRTPEGAGRPELLIPKSSALSQPDDPTTPTVLGKGVRVRGLREPYLGSTGVVRDLPSNAQLVESGVRLQVAEVELDPHRDVALIPLTNLELVR